MIQLVAFFGNPGPTYSGNRHNAGQMLAESASFLKPLEWQKKFKSLYASATGDALASLALQALPADSAGQAAAADRPPRVHFVVPQTFMNLSGQAVQAAASFFKIESGGVLVVHDELEIPLGTISLKYSGGLGGHNGLRSMKACFGTADFWRLRIGIGRPDARLPGEGGPAGSGRGIADWVLSDFSSGELETLHPALEAAGGLLLRIFSESPNALLEQGWAKKKIAPL